LIFYIQVLPLKPLQIPKRWIVTESTNEIKNENENISRSSLPLQPLRIPKPPALILADLSSPVC